MAMLEPTFCILDETDSGLDVDALRIVAEGFNKLRKPETSAIVITHYQRLLDYLKPDVVHILIDGKIIKTGGRSDAPLCSSRPLRDKKSHVNEAFPIVQVEIFLPWQSTHPDEIGVF